MADTGTELSVFILEMQACRLAAGSGINFKMPDPAFILGCPTQVIPKMGRAIHFPAGYAALGTKEWSAAGGNGEAVR